MTVRHSNYNTHNPLYLSSIFVPALEEVLNQATTACAQTSKKSTWCPLADVVETSSAYLIRLDLPGISRDTLSVHFDEQGDLMISSNSVKDELNSTAKESQKYLLRERPPSFSFERVIKLGKDVDQEHVEAKLSDGVLEIKVNRLQPSKRSIAIN